jgi:hypothetical protein
MTIGANRASRAAAIVIFVHDRKARADFRFGRFCCKSRL